VFKFTYLKLVFIVSAGTLYTATHHHSPSGTVGPISHELSDSQIYWLYCLLKVFLYDLQCFLWSTSFSSLFCETHSFQAGWSWWR